MSKPTRTEHPHANTEQAENKRGKYRLYNSFSFGNFNIAFFFASYLLKYLANKAYWKWWVVGISL